MINKFDFPDTFSVAVGLNYSDENGIDQFLRMYKDIHGEDIDIEKSKDLFFGRLVHFSTNIYDGDQVLSDDNAPNEITGYTSNGKDFAEYFKYNKNVQNFIGKASVELLKKELLAKNFKKNDLYNVFKNCTDTGENEFYVLDKIKSIDECKQLFLFIREMFLKAKALEWNIILEKNPDLIGNCPLDILRYVKPKLKTAIDMGILDESSKIQTFKQFDSRVWDLKRKAVKPHNMPNIARQNDYLQTVKEEIAQILKNIYNFSQQNIDIIQNSIWLDLKAEWQDILDDSLVNWDTPQVCAQKCLTKMKEFIPLIGEA